MLTCPLCEKTFNARRVLDSHIFSHTKEKPHKCPTCSTTFPRLESLTTHIKRVHSVNKIKKLQCPECSHKFSDRGGLKKHLVTHSAELRFSCSVSSCSFKTKHKACLARHIRGVHNQSTPYKCKFDGCNYETSASGNLNRHLKVHSNERPFACKVSGCNYTCKTKEFLQIHVRGFHCGQKPWKCSTCDFRTNHKPYLKKHQAAHSGIKRFQCPAPNCRYTCNANNKLILHFDRKHRKKQLLCTEVGCKYRCGSTLLLEMHRNDHKLPILKCPANSCDYSTRWKSNFHFHVSSYHGGDKQCVSPLESRQPDSVVAEQTCPVETRHCPFSNCGYRTDFPHRYDRHVIAHDKDEQRKYICNFCSSKFTLLKELESHIQRHVGEKPYNCSLCGYTATNGWDLRHHAERVHRVYVIPLGDEHQSARKCRTCDLTFSSYSQFVVHSMTHLKPVVMLERLRFNVM